ncbi:MAG: glycoside hydrolase family 25 protein [Rhizobiaceae bacterium]
MRIFPEIRRLPALRLLPAAAFLLAVLPATASEFSKPWLNKNRALVIDAYEYNPLDWKKLAANKRITAFINKGSDGLPPAYRCSGDETERRLCKALWKRYSVARELFHTRKTIVKSLGLEWGAYHVARPGNPIDQANHFLDFVEPEATDLMALDLEGLDTEKWMSLEDAEIFVRHIKYRTGRYPILYANEVTAQYIADNRDRYRLLSRLPLWYARYRPNIRKAFPKGHWQRYALWQFSASANCNKRRCPYRIAGAKNDIDVNVAPMDAETLRKYWPFGSLLDQRQKHLSEVPVPVSRKLGLAGAAKLTIAKVSTVKAVTQRYGYALRHLVGTAEYIAFLKDASRAYRQAGELWTAAEIDKSTTSSVALKKKRERRLPRIQPKSR